LSEQRFWTVIDAALGFKEWGFCDRVSRVSLRVVDAIVLLEVLLRNAVEGERGNRTLQKRSRHTPCAVGAAPAAEVITVDPDQVFIHTICLCAGIGIKARAMGWISSE